MWKELKRFEDESPDLNLRSKAWKEGKVLRVAFELTGDIDKALLPKPLLSPGRVIGLWESTCFEVFIKNQKADEYLEFNVSSEYNWNVFYFKNKKSRLKEYEKITNLGVSAVREDKRYCLTYRFPISKLPENFWQQGQMRVGLTAVLEDQDTCITHSALEHKDKKPNFHHHDSFLYQI